MGTKSREEHGIDSRAVEFQMRFREILCRASGAVEPTAPHRTLGPYVAISRETASAGVEIARRVASRLGDEWRVLDRELVEILARQLEVSPSLLELMDETRSNWFSDSLLTLLEPHLTIQDSYVDMLRKIMLLAATDGRVIIVGRGAGFMLPRQTGLRVRIVAPEDQRLHRLAAERGLDLRAAAKLLRETDQSRNDFVRHHFHRDPTDPAGYDLVVDSSAFGLEGTAELICNALELRGAHLEQRAVSGAQALLEDVAPPARQLP